MHALMAELYPICRSLTGDGVRETFEILERDATARDHRGPERDAGLRLDAAARVEHPRSLDRRRRTARGSSTSADSNLHVLGYSTPVTRTLSLAELRGTSTRTPTNPDWIPFRTSYYDENWGFCLAHVNSSSSPRASTRW